MRISISSKASVVSVGRITRAAVALVICAVAPLTAQVRDDSGSASDLKLLSAMLEAASREAQRMELRVDPRPLLAAFRNHSIRAGGMAPLSSATQRARVAVIRAAGFRAVDATKVGQNQACPGTFALVKPDSTRVSNSYPGCPNRTFAVLVVGLPRIGTAVRPQGEVYDRQTESAAQGYWAARVIRTTLTPNGSSVYASDYVLSKRDGMWTVVKIIGLMYTE